ncbi:MAG TPA: ATP-binding protein [Chloroflexota bacterium]|nr:ATP-binding protein [Chloroflexota bacterium]
MEDRWPRVAEPEPDPSRSRMLLPTTTLLQGMRGSLLALAVASLLSLVLLALRAHLSTANVALLYLLPVLAGATVGGLIPGVLASVVCTLAFDLLFIRPYGALTVESGQDLLTLGLYLSVGALAAELAARARARTQEAARRAATNALLYDLSSVFLADDLDAMLAALVARLRTAFALRSCAILLPDDGGALQHRAQSGLPLSRVHPEDEQRLMKVAAWTYERGDVVGLSLERSVPLTTRGLEEGEIVPPKRAREGGKDTVLFLPLRTSQARGGKNSTGVLALGRPAGAPLSPEETGLLETFATQAALAVDRTRLAEESAQAAVLRESDRAKSALLSNVSHDLRTPLTIIHGAAESLLARDVPLDDATRQELLGSIRDEAERLTTLVSNLLNLSRLEAGALRPDRHLYHLSEIISHVIGRLGPRLAGHVPRLAVESDVPAVLVDYLLLEQVLVNLIDNAVQYTPEGGSITVGLHRDADQAILSVSDNGPGIPLAARDRVFERFYRLPAAHGRRVPGTGLGLAICQAVVAAHGGTIWIDDGAPTGARITIALPIPSLEASQEPAPAGNRS